MSGNEEHGVLSLLPRRGLKPFFGNYSFAQLGSTQCILLLLSSRSEAAIVSAPPMDAHHMSCRTCAAFVERVKSQFQDTSQNAKN